MFFPRRSAARRSAFLFAATLLSPVALPLTIAGCGGHSDGVAEQTLTPEQIDAETEAASASLDAELEN